MDDSGIFDETDDFHHTLTFAADERIHFENLFDQLGRLRDGFVDIEVQHSAPFRLVLERRYEELL